MKRVVRWGFLLAGLGLTALLSGCPGMTGQPGTSAAQQPPPGILPPPGLKTGGVRTLVGATITPPEGQVIVVNYPGNDDHFTSVRRISVTENTVLFEGLNFDGRTPDQEKDQNHLVPLSRVIQLRWKYEPAPSGFNAPAAAPGAPAASKAPANAPAKAPANAPANAPKKPGRIAAGSGEGEDPPRSFSSGQT